MKKNHFKTILILQLLLVFYSFSEVFSKQAAAENFLSMRFCLYYGCVLLLMGVYAIAWQQIIKHLPLTTAFANKAITIAWGILWGKLFFQERIGLGKIIGAVLVIVGVILFSKAGDDLEG